MERTRIRIKSVEEIHIIFRCFRSHPPTGWWYRGQVNIEWPLIPKAGRKEYFCNESAYGRFVSWKKKACAYDQNLPSNEWELLAVAQHHGLATCLLDWTYNPLVALHFACKELPDDDGIIYCYEPCRYIDEEILRIEEIQSSGYAFVPRAITPRYVNQRGVFSVHISANQEPITLEHPALKGQANLAEIIIPSEFKPDLTRMLDLYGVNYATLFPDLDGLSRYVNWETELIVKKKI